MKLRELSSGLRFPEGPVPMEDGSVIVVEIGGACVTRVRPDGSKHVIVETGGGPNGAAIGPDGAVYTCDSGGSAYNIIDGIWFPADRPDAPPGWIDRIDLATGKAERLYESCDGQPFSRPNDLVFDDAGGFWFTDLGRDRGTSRAHGAIYYAKADGSSIKRVAYKLMTPNGIGLSPDGKTLYFAETLTARLCAIPLSGPGTPAEPPKAHHGEIAGQLLGNALFDSLAVLEDGTIAVATMNVDPGVTVFKRGAGVVETVAIDDPLVTNIAFGGRDMRTAYITSSGRGHLLTGEWSSPGLRLAYNA